MASSDFNATDLLTDWNNVLSVGGAVTFAAQATVASGIWAQRVSAFEDMEEQLRNERVYTVFLTTTQLPAVPTLRSTLVRSGITYSVQAVRQDAEGVGIEIDVKQTP
jgi:hypothetical protein